MGERSHRSQRITQMTKTRRPAGPVHRALARAVEETMTDPVSPLLSRTVVETLRGLQQSVGNAAVARALGPATAPIQRAKTLHETAQGVANKSPVEKAKAIKSVIEDDFILISLKIRDIFKTAASPAEFIEIQQHLDMPAVIAELDTWDAVLVGTLGPVVSGADKLNQKRVEYIIEAEFDYGPAEAEVFIHYMFTTMYTNDMRDVLKQLAADKRLGSTINKMESVQKIMADRGIKPDEFKDREESAKDFFRGLGRGLESFAESSQLEKGKKGQKFLSEQGDLPKEYREALDAVLKAELTAHIEGLATPKGMVMGALDEATMGMASGLYGLVAGTAGAIGSLAKGELEKAGEELTPAAMILATYLGVRAYRAATGPKVVLGPTGPMQFQIKGFQGPIPREVARLGSILALNAEGQAVGGLLISRFGQPGVVQLARWVQADSRAAVFVHEHGLPALEALEKSGGDLAKARAMVPAKPAGLLAAENVVTGEQAGVVVNWSKPLSATGIKSSFQGEKLGVYEGTIPGVKEPVAIKVYPEGHPIFAVDVAGAEAAAKTGMGPKFYGEVNVGPGKKAFAMEKIPGGFPDNPAKLIGGPREAFAQEAGHLRSKVGPHTIQDAQNFADRFLQQGYYYFGEFQGLVDDAGRWRPIDFQGTAKLPPPTKAAERAAAIKSHQSNVADEINGLRKIVEENKGKGTP